MTKRSTTALRRSPFQQAQTPPEGAPMIGIVGGPPALWGPTQMPPLATDVVDPKLESDLREWIESLTAP